MRACIADDAQGAALESVRAPISRRPGPRSPESAAPAVLSFDGQETGDAQRKDGLLRVRSWGPAYEHELHAYQPDGVAANARAERQRPARRGVALPRMLGQAQVIRVRERPYPVARRSLRHQVTRTDCHWQLLAELLLYLSERVCEEFCIFGRVRQGQPYP